MPRHKNCCGYILLNLIRKHGVHYEENYSATDWVFGKLRRGGKVGRIKDFIGGSPLQKTSADQGGMEAVF